MVAKHANKLFRHDEVARIVGPDEIDVISPVSAAYGLAIILDSDLAVVDYIQKDDAPRRLQSDELALIATDDLLRVSYLSGVPNVNGDKEIGVQIDRLTEEDGISGKERTIRGKIVLEFRIDRYNRKIANRIHSLMRDGGSDRLTKKDFLKNFGNDTKDNITDFVQTFIDENGYARGGHRFRARALEALSPTLEEYGVQFRNILRNVDKRSGLTRLVWPSVQYDPRWVVTAKLVIPIFTTAVSLLVTAYITGFFDPPVAPPRVTIGEHTNGTVSITGDNCPTSQVCDVSKDGSVTVSAIPASSDYKLAEWNCIGCTSELGSDNPVSINGITDDLMITPIFKPLATVNVIPNNPELGRVSCEINGIPATSCSGIAGEVVTIEANKRTRNDSDSFVSEFVGWSCSDAWCAGVDLSSRIISLSIPDRDSPGRLNVSAQFREDRLIKLRINPIEPSGVDVRVPAVTGCSLPSCIMMREGITEVYVFQQNSAAPSPLPLTLQAPVPELDSTYTFDRWICNEGPCSLLANAENSVTRISLNDDVTITPTYTEQVIITIQNRVNGGQVEYIGSLPQDCNQTSTSTRCRFSADEFDGLQLNVVAQPSNDDDFRFVEWTCHGSWCQNARLTASEDLTFREFVDRSLTLTPIFAPIKRTTLTLLNPSSGNSRAEADCGSNCAGEAGWQTRVIALQQGEMQFMRWQCLSGSSSCPSGSDLTSPIINLTLDHDVTLMPIYVAPPTLTLEFNNTQEGTISCTPSDCSATSDNTIRFSLDADSLPETLQFREWVCSSASDNHCREIENSSLSSTGIRVRDLSSDVIVTLIPRFDEVQIATLQIGDAEGGNVNVGCGSDCEMETPWSTTVTAMANDGYKFVEWICVEGSCPSGDLSQSSISVTVNEDTQLRPSFQVDEVQIATLRIGDAEGGSVRVGCSSDCEREIPWNTTISAIASDGYEFVEWVCVEGSCPSGSLSQSSISVTVNEDTQLRPSFQMVESTQSPPFKTTGDTYSETSNWDSIVSSEFGSSYRVVDWSDLVEYHGNGGDLLQTIHGLSNIVPGEADPGVRSSYPADNPVTSFYVTYNDSRNSGSRYYFASLYKNEVRGGFAVAGRINLQGYVLALGSYFNLDLPVLATLSQATTSTPSTSTTTTSQFQTTSNTYSETENWNTIVSNEFGSSYRVVDWDDIVQYHNDEGDLLQTINNLSNIVPGEADPGARNRHPADNPITSFYVTYNGSKNTGTRYYFVSLYKNRVRSGFAVHASINLQGHVLAVGSWQGLDLPVLAISSQ